MDSQNNNNNQEILVNSDAHEQTISSFSPAEFYFDNDDDSQPWLEARRHTDSEGHQPSPTLSQLDFDDEETIFDAHMEDDESINSNVFEPSLSNVSPDYDPENIIEMFNFVVNNFDLENVSDQDYVMNIYKKAKNSDKNINNYLQESSTNLCIEYKNELYLTTVYDLQKNVLHDSKSLIVRLKEDDEQHTYYNIEFVVGSQCYVTEILFTLLSNPFCCQTITIIPKENVETPEYILYENLNTYNKTLEDVGIDSDESLLKFIEKDPITYNDFFCAKIQYPTDYVFPELKMLEPKQENEDLHFNVLIQGIKIKIFFDENLTINDVKQQLSEKVKIELPYKYSNTQFVDVSKQIKLIHMGKFLKENKSIHNMMEQYGNGFTMNGLIKETIGGKKSKKRRKGVSNKKTKRRKSKNK